jgi:hypothetical protein
MLSGMSSAETASDPCWSPELLLSELLLLELLLLELLLEQAARARTMTRARSSAKSFLYFFIWTLIPFFFASLADGVIFRPPRCIIARSQSKCNENLGRKEKTILSLI